MKDLEMKPGVYVRIREGNYRRTARPQDIGKIIKITKGIIQLNNEVISTDGLKKLVHVAIHTDNGVYWSDDLELISKEELALMKLKQ